MVKFKKIFAALVAVFALILCGLFQSALISYAASEQVISGGDGTYSVPVDLSGLTMGKDNFTETATVEKQGEKYYFTFGFSSSIGYVNLSVGGTDSGKEIGKTTEKKDGWTYHTYTLSETNLKGNLRVAAYINAMKRETSFNISIKWSTRKKTSEEIRDIGERPAEFVPVIQTKAAVTYSLKVGTVFPVPEATATLGNENCEVFTTVTRNGEVVEITNGRFVLDSVGTYKLVYKATNSQYKTSSGNDTFTEYVVEIDSTTGENNIVKFEDENKILPENASVLAGKADEMSSEYKKAASAMKKIADNFEVFSVALVDGNGEKITPNGSVKFMFRADDYFDRSKVEVYYMDEDGGITELSAKGYGRYVSAETDKTGTFIVCIPGVAFVMPMWGYALILAGAVVLIAAAIVVTIVLVKKKGRMRL